MANPIDPAPSSALPHWVVPMSLSLAASAALLSFWKVPFAWLGTGSLILGVWALSDDGLQKRQKRMSLLAVVAGSVLMLAASVDFVIHQAIPGIVEAGRRAAARKAVSNLRFIYAAQVKFKETKYVDADGDGLAEFGFLGDLSGGNPPRGSEVPLSPPFLAYPFTHVVPGNLGGVMVIGAYTYAIYLPGVVGSAAENGSGGVGTDLVDANGAESHFVAYAWPSYPGRSGDMIYAINEQELVLQSVGNAQGQGYHGSDKMPAWDAALVNKAFGASMGTGVTGDKGEWTPWKGKKPRTAP